MTRRACTFRKADVKRAIQATEEAGAQVSRIEIDRANGKIILIIDKPDAPTRTEEIVL